MTFALSLTNKESYKDGVSLSVTDDYLVPSQLGGIVVFVGEKEGYGKTVVVQQYNGIDLWYGNIKPNEDKVITDEGKELIQLIAQHHESLSSLLLFVFIIDPILYLGHLP